MAYVLVFSIQRGNLKLLAIATPHQPRFAQQLPQRGSQGGCAARVAKLATPTGCRENHWLAATNEVHSLSLALLGSSLREGAKTAAPLAGRLPGDPYRTGANRFLRGIEPGGSKNQRMSTSPVRHCPAALPPNVNWYFIISAWRSWCMTPSAILRMSREATKAMAFSASSRGTL